MRHVHYVKANHRSETIHEFISVDTETSQKTLPDGGIKQTLTFGWASYDRDRGNSHWIAPHWLRFDRPRIFWSWVDSHTRPKQTLYLFCLNSAFDYVVLDAFKELKALGWTATWGIIDKLPFVVKASKGTAKLILLDTLNWWRCSAAELGRSVGVEKLPMPASTDSAAKWDEYCKQDTEIIRRAVLAWRDFLLKEDLGKFKFTLAGQAMQCYRHRFMEHKILVHSHEASLKLERDAYHGGRTELFYHGQHRGRFYHLDVNSMYPAVMREGLYPARWYGYRRNPDTARFEMWLKNYRVIARCRVETDLPLYAMMRDGKLIFPIGRFTTALTHAEIMEARRRGHIKEVLECSIYQPAPLFRKFVDYLYRHRLKAKKQGDAVRTYMFKIMMNSLYGKFGQSGRVWETVETTDNLQPYRETTKNMRTGEVKHYSRVAGLIQEYKDVPEARESCPSIAAEVTAQARLKLWRLIEKAGIKNVYYCDTDSIICNSAGYKRLKDEIDPDRLGALKLEARYRYLDLRGPKDYTFDDKTKIKGVRKTAVEVQPGVFKQERWPGWAGMIRAGDVSTVIVYPVTKHLSRIYDKGRILSNKRVSPLVISEDV